MSKIICIFDSVTSIGKGYNRKKQPGEFEVKLDAKDIAWFFSTPDRYMYSNGKFSEVPGWHDDKLKRKKQQVFDTKKMEIDKYYMETKEMYSVSYKAKSETQTSLFPVNVNAIWSSKDYCQSLGMADKDTIPQNGGKWDTVNIEVSVPFTVADLKGLWDAVYKRGMQNYDVYKQHIIAVLTIMRDEEKTIEDIINYDFSGGWIL